MPIIKEITTEDSNGDNRKTRSTNKNIKDPEKLRKFIQKKTGKKVFFVIKEK